MILFIGAHADDVTLGTGGTILKRLDSEVSLLCATICDYRNPTIKEERIDILDKLYPNATLHTFSYHDQKLDIYPMADLVDSIRNIIQLEEPTDIFTHCSDDNLDHDLVYQATLTAARKTKANIFLYSVPGVPNKLKPNTFSDISSKMNQKILDFQKFNETHPTTELILEHSTHHKNCYCPLETGFYEGFECRRNLI